MRVLLRLRMRLTRWVLRLLLQVRPWLMRRWQLGQLPLRRKHARRWRRWRHIGLLPWLLLLLLWL